MARDALIGERDVSVIRYWLISIVLATSPIPASAALSATSEVDAVLAHADRALQNTVATDTRSTGSLSVAESAHHLATLRALDIDDARLESKRGALLPFFERQVEHPRFGTRAVPTSPAIRLRVNADGPHPNSR